MNAAAGAAMILILTKRGDAHAEAVESVLRRRGARVARFDPGGLSAHARISVEAGAGAWVETDDGTLDLDEVRVAWYRRPGAVPADGRVADPQLRRHLELEWERFLDGVWDALECAWLPATPAGQARAGHALRQLRLAAALGFAVPATLLTNDARALVRFYEEHEGRLVSELPGAAQPGGPRALHRGTQPVTRGHLARFLGLRHAPVIFQPRLDAACALRVTVVGEVVLAAEVDGAPTADGPRRSRPGARPHALPPEVEARCRALTRRLGLIYGAIDLILTPDDEYVFLRLNPSGDHLWIEERAGLPITQAIAELLLTYEVSNDHVAA